MKGSLLCVYSDVIDRPENPNSYTCWSSMIVLPSGSESIRLAGPVVASSASLGSRVRFLVIFRIFV